MWICIFDNEYTRIWLCEYVQLAMLGYGHDESAPTPDGVFAPISWVLRKHSPNVRNVFAIWLIYIRKMFATCWLSVCYSLTEQKGGFCIAKVWFLACKKGFLMDKNRVLHF